VATVFIPTMLQGITGGLKQVEVEGETVGEIVDKLDAAHPGMKARLVEGGALRRNLAVAVDGEVSVMGLLEDVPEGAEVHFVPAISGGAETLGGRERSNRRCRLMLF
jgi:molybdopterin converting factor small subunit